MSTETDPSDKGNNPLRIEGVTNHERVMIADQMTGVSSENVEDYALGLAGHLMKALLSREKTAFALIEYLVNTGNGKVAGRIIGALAIQSCQMRHQHKALLEANPMGITPSAIKALEERIAGADMGLSVNDLQTMLGELPDF